jgi:TonB family protein
MGNVTSESGIFYFKDIGAAGAFPQDLRRGLLGRIEPRFVAIFGGLVLVFAITIFLLSLKKITPTAFTEEEIRKVQTRYASLVLNQPKPEIKPVEKVQKTAKTEGSTEKKGADEGKKETPKVDREKESFAQREARRESSREVREQVRAKVNQQVMSSGIFAAITATSSGKGGSGGAQVSDLLGSAGAELSDIGSMNISKGTFATKNVDAASLGTHRKGERVSDVGIQRSEVGRAAVNQVASIGSVNITSKAPEITGESATSEERSQAAIGRVVTREQQRLKRVYEDWLKRDPQLSGNLTVKFTILPEGGVSNVSIVKSTTNNSDFDEAVLRYIKRWQFPPVQGGGSVEVVYPFVFEGQS